MTSVQLLCKFARYNVLALELDLSVAFHGLVIMFLCNEGQTWIGWNKAWVPPEGQTSARRSRKRHRLCTLTFLTRDINRAEHAYNEA